MMPTYETTAMHAEWDLDHRVVYTLRFRDDTERPTGQPRVEDARTVWLPIVRELPDDFLPAFRELLGPAQHRLSDDEEAVIEHYPSASFTPDTVREFVINQVNLRAKDILRSTDWYVTRKVETGRDIPPAILEAREGVRYAVRAETLRLQVINPSELQEYNTVELNNAARELTRAELDDQLGPDHHIPS